MDSRPMTDIAALINSLLAHAQDMGHEARANVLRDAAAALRSLAQELERTKDDLRRVQSVYDFAALTAERDALAQEVERLKERNSSKIGAIECLKNEVERANKRIRELEAGRDAIRAKTIEECAMATLTTTPKAIRALATEATEAGQESEKLDQKSRPSV